MTMGRTPNAPNHTPKPARITIYLPEEVKAWLQMQSVDLEAPMSYVLLRIIRSAMRAQEKEARNER